MSKKYFTGLNAVKEQFDAHQNMPLSVNPNVIMPDIDLYHTNYNYAKVENIDDRNKLLQYEFTVSNGLNQINKCLKDICEKLYLARQVLASYDKNHGLFVEWYESLGLEKKFVYRCIDRYQMFLDTNKDVYLTEKISIRSIQLVKLLSEIAKIKVAEKVEDNELVNSTQIAKYLTDHFPRVGNDLKIWQEKIVTKNHQIIQGKKQLQININGKFSITEMQHLSLIINDFIEALAFDITIASGK